MPKGVTPSLLEDASRFSSIAEILQHQPLSIRQLANVIRPRASTTAISDCLARLERSFNARLLEKSADGGYKLTPEGHALFERTSGLTAALGRDLSSKVSNRIEIITSRTLLSAYGLDRVIADFVGRYRDSVDIGVQTESDFTQSMNALVLNEVDFAILPIIEGRLIPSGIEVEKLNPGLDVVLVTDDPDLARSFVTSGKAHYSLLRSKRVVRRKPESQPFIAEIPRPDPSNGGSEQVANSMSEVLALVRTNGGCAIVPSVYAEFDVYRDQLYWSEPLGQIHLGLYFRKSSRSKLPDAGKHLLLRITEHLAVALKDKLPTSENQPRALPDNCEDYREYAFGYFVDRIDVHSPALWSSEVLVWRETSDHSICWEATNHRDEVYILEGRLIPPNLLLLQATGKKVGEKTPSPFAAILTAVLEENKEILIGTWSGLGPKSRPSVFTIILSKNRLTLEKLRSFARTLEFGAHLNSFGASLNAGISPS